MCGADWLTGSGFTWQEATLLSWLGVFLSFIWGDHSLVKWPLQLQHAESFNTRSKLHSQRAGLLPGGTSADVPQGSWPCSGAPEAEVQVPHRWVMSRPTTLFPRLISCFRHSRRKVGDVDAVLITTAVYVLYIQV